MMERRGLPMLNHVLQHTLRSLCCDSQWVYAVFWRILPRNYPPPKWENEGGAIDRSKGNKRNWILVWEDGFCDFPACTSSGREAQMGSRYGNHGFNHADESTETTMHPELFFKMSHEVYNYGEGLMGKVAADNSHKWVYREPMEHEISFLSPWHGSLDPHPRTWEAQFKTGIQTIAVISVREGLVQLGSTKKVVEDLNFVILMQRKFNYLQSIPGVFVPHPSPLPGMKRRDGTDGLSPTDGSSFWPGSRDQNLISGLFARSANADPYRMNPANATQFGSGVLGIKRPGPDNDIPLGLSATGRDFPFLSSGINFNGSPRFDCRQSNGQPECPSPPKALNTGHSPNSVSLLPSMSSLHNLLSKLPSVTAPESGNAGISSSPSGLSLPSNQLQHRPRQPMSPSSSTDSPRRGMSGSGAEDHSSSPRSSSPSRQQQHRQHTVSGLDSPGPTSTSPRLDRDGTGAGDTGTSGSPHQHGPSSISRSSRSEFAADSRSLLRDHHGHRLASIGPAIKVDKLTSFLDSFDQDSLTDLDLHDDLENSETYNSFLSEII